MKRVFVALFAIAAAAGSVAIAPAANADSAKLDAGPACVEAEVTTSPSASAQARNQTSEPPLNGIGQQQCSSGPAILP